MSDTTPGSIIDVRHNYDRDTLVESRAASDPFAQFKAWSDDVFAAKLHEPNAMTLATVDAAGNPAARIVLLRGWDERGFVFFTNYESAKGDDLAAHPVAALILFWDLLQRQVRITGSVAKIDPTESDRYFASRPRGSQVGAWASPQSSPVAGRDVLDARMAEMEARFAGGDVPRPPYWGGYRVVPSRFEFWQGRPNRVHDRIAYAIGAEKKWELQRLGP